MDTLIDCLTLYHDALWRNVSTGWKIVLTPIWLTFPLFYVSALLLEIANAEKEK